MNNENNLNPNLGDLCSKLDILIAFIAIQDISENIDKVLRLRKLNYPIKDISKIIDVTSRTVDNYISELKKQKKL